MSLIVDHTSAQNLIRLPSNIGGEGAMALSYEAAPPLAASSAVKRALTSVFPSRSLSLFCQ